MLKIKNVFYLKENFDGKGIIIIIHPSFKKRRKGDLKSKFLSVLKS